MDMPMERSVDDPAAVVAAFEGRARRVETPCGEGVMVWHGWGSGPPLMLAHGSHGGWSHWIRNIDALAERRTVWAADLPGYGESAMPESEDHDAISRAIADGVRQIVGKAGPIDIAGFSFGGVASAHFAARYPELVRRLVLVGTGGLDTPMGHIELQRLRGLEGEAREAGQRANLLALMIHGVDKVDALALYVQSYTGRKARLAPNDLVLPDRLLDALPRLSMPVGAIWGAHDQPHPDPSAQEAVLRSFFPDMDFRAIAGAGHWVMYEQPEAFNRALIEMLDAPMPG